MRLLDSSLLKQGTIIILLTHVLSGFIVSGYNCDDPAEPYTCPPKNMCYGPYYYCSSLSGTKEPCVKEDILKNNASRFELCQNIIQGKPVSTPINHESCKLKADCFAEFGSQPTCFAVSQDSTNWIITVVVLSIVIVVLLIVIFLCWRRSKRSTEKDEEAAPNNTNNNGQPPHNIENERELANADAQTDQLAEFENNDNTNRAENMPLIRRQSQGVSNAHSSSGESAVSSSPEIDIPISSSGNVTQSNHSSASSITSSGGEQEEENQHPASPNSTHQNRNDFVHPSEIESANQRSWHMPSTEPSDSRQQAVVTSHSKYNNSNRE